MARLFHVDFRPGDGFARCIDDHDCRPGLAVLFDPRVSPGQ